MNTSTDSALIAHTAAQGARSAPGRVVRAPRGTQLTCKSWLTIFDGGFNQFKFGLACGENRLRFSHQWIIAQENIPTSAHGADEERQTNDQQKK